MKKYHHILWAVAALALPMLFTACDERITEPEEQEPVPEEVHTEEVDGTICVSEKYVDVDWQESTNKVIVADTASGHFVLRTDAETAKSIKKGSLLTLDCDSDIFLRKVLSVSRNGGIVDMETRRGSLGELLAGSHFVIATGPLPDSVKFLNAQGQSIRPIYPTYSRVKNEATGEWERVPSYLTRGALDWKSLGLNTEFTPSITLKKPTSTGVDLAASIGGIFKIHTLVATAHEFNFEGVDDSESLIDVVFHKTYAYTKPDYKFGLEIGAEAGLALEKTLKYNKKTKKIESETSGNTFNKIEQEEREEWDALNSETSQEVDQGEGKPKLNIKFKGSFEPSFKLFATVSAAFTYLITYGNGDQQQCIVTESHLMSTAPYIKNVTHQEGLVRPSLTMNFRAEGSLGAEFSFMPNVNLQIGGQDVLTAGAGITGCAIATGGGDVDLNFDSGVQVEGSPTWKQEVGCAGEWKVELNVQFLKDIVGGFPGFSTDKNGKLTNRWIPMESVEWLELSHEWGGKVWDKTVWEAPTKLILTFGKEGAKVGQMNYIGYEIHATRFGEDILCPEAALVWFATEDGANELSFDEKATEEELTNHACMLFSDNEPYIWWRPKSTDSRLIARIHMPGGEKLEAEVALPVQPEPDKPVVEREGIDMGGDILWANMNVGAETPEEHGDYVGWGAKSSHIYYQWDMMTAADNYMTFEQYLDTYGSDDAHNYADNTDDIGGTSRDYAKRNWKGTWRMPTVLEWQDLLDNCTWTATTKNGVNGYDVASKITGNHIFLPKCGFRCGTKKMATSVAFEYWSSTQYDQLYESDDPNWLDFTDHYAMAWEISLIKDELRLYPSQKCYGYPIRPVCGKYDFSDE